MSKTFEEFCRSNILEVILSNHNEGGSRDVERLTRMAYEEYINNPHLRHIDSYYLRDIHFYRPPFSRLEKKLVKQHKLTECFVDLDTADNWCIKTERYLLHKLKRTDTRDNCVIASSSTFLKNRELAILKYCKVKFRLEREERQKAELAEKSRRAVPKMSMAGPLSRKRAITDFFPVREEEKEQPMSPKKKKLKTLRLFNEPDQDMYSHSPSPVTPADNATIVNNDNQVESNEIEIPESLKSRPGPASRKKFLIEQYLEEEVAKRTNIVKTTNAPQAEPSPSLPPVTTELEHSSSSTPPSDPFVSTNDSEIDRLKDEFRSRKVSVKPGPKSKQKEQLERIQRMEAVIKACPASKKQQLLKEIIDKSEEDPNKDQLVDQENIVKNEQTLSEDLNNNSPQSEEEEVEIPEAQSKDKVPQFQTSEEAYANAKRGSKLWLLLHGTWDPVKKCFYDTNPPSPTNLFPVPEQQDAEDEESQLNGSRRVRKPLAKFAPLIASSPMPQSKDLLNHDLPYLPRPLTSHQITSTSQVHPVDEMGDSLISLVLEKNIRDVLHPKVFHYPELLRKVKEMLVAKAKSFEEAQNAVPVEDKDTESPSNQGGNEDSVTDERETAKVITLLRSESGGEGPSNSRQTSSAKSPKYKTKEAISCFRQRLSFMDKSSGTNTTSQDSFETVIEVKRETSTQSQIVAENASVHNDSTPMVTVPEMIVCDQLGTQSQSLVNTQPNENPLQTQDFHRAPDEMLVDSEVEVATIPEESVIEIEDDSMSLEEIMRLSPEKPTPATPIKTKVPSPKMTSIMDIESIPKLIPIQSRELISKTPQQPRTPLTRSKLINTSSAVAASSPSSAVKKNKGNRSPKAESSKKAGKELKVKEEKEEQSESGDRNKSKKEMPPLIKVGFRYNALPLQRKGPAAEGATKKKGAGRRKKNPTKRTSEDVYTMVRFGEETEGTAAGLDIQDASMLEEEMAVVASGKEKARTRAAKKDKNTLLNKLKELAELRKRESTSGGQLDVNKLTHHKTARLQYEADDKGNFYSDACGRCAMQVDFTVDGMRRVRFEVDEDVNRYLLDLTRDQWDSFQSLLQKLGKFEYSGWAKEQAANEDDDDEEENEGAMSMRTNGCCVIKKVLNCLLKTTPKLGVNVGAIKCTPGVGSKLKYYPRAPQGNVYRKELNLSECLDPFVLKKLEAIVSARVK